MRPDHRRGVGEELATRERRPERLVNLRHHPRLEDRHVSHTPVVASWGGPILRRAPDTIVVITLRATLGLDDDRVRSPTRVGQLLLSENLARS